MIATILTTMLMALGVATGNVSSNTYKGGNAFNNVEKETKPQLRSEEQNLSYAWAISKVDEIANNETGISTAKYYINKFDGLQPNATNGYFNIYNTTYVYSYTYQNYIVLNVLTLIKFTPYFNYNNERTRISSEVDFAYLSGTNWYGIYSDNWIATDEILDYIDLTLTNNTPNILRNYTRDAVKNNVESSTIAENTGSSYYNGNLLNAYEIVGLQAQNDYYVAMHIEIDMALNQNQQLDHANITPNQVLITGTAIIPDVNYEVVDVPNLMYTILTMPFSFISTAFNLTVFPGTPYALNFGNLFLTILAVFILMWLLNKVFK